MTIDLAFITFNRLEYTKKALASVLAGQTEEFNLYIWDNASTDGTVEFLKREVSDHRVKEMVFSKSNVGQTKAVNTIWQQSKADLVGKLDNDCLVTPGWTRTLARAHADIPRLGVVACWHYFASDFDFQRAKHKIQQFGEHQILRHPWTCGTGLLLKRATFVEAGPFRDGATTSYWMNLACMGYINGFYYPLIMQEHMDDPKSSHSMLKDEASYNEAKKVTFSLNNLNLQTLDDRLAIREKILSNLLDEPWEVQH
jgi:GT2 family glycosyltransferase